MQSIEQVIPFLPKIAIEYKGVGGIADKLLGLVRVATETGKYTKFSSDTAFSMDDPTITRNGEANEVDLSETQDSYLAKSYAEKQAVDFNLAALTPLQVNRVNRAVEFLSGRLKRWKEYKVATAISGATHDAYNATGYTGYVWTNLTQSSPVKDLKVLRRKLPMPPNVLVLGKPVFDLLQYHPEVVGLRPVNRPGSINPAEMAAIFEVDQVLVPEIKYNNAGNRGRAQTLDYIWGNEVFFLYKSPNEELSESDITYMSEFRVEAPQVTGAPRVSNVYMAAEDGFIVRSWEDAKRGLNGTAIIQVGHQYDLKVVASDLGRGLTGVI